MIIVGQEGPTVRKLRSVLQGVHWGTALEPVICWGYPPSSLHWNHPTLNKRLIFDKLEQLRRFQNEGVSTPTFTTNPTFTDNRIWLARNRCHERGLDVIGPMGTTTLRLTLERGERDYGIEFIDKTHEWRIHVFGPGGTTRVGRKRWYKTGVPRSVVWNEDAGWSFDYLSPGTPREVDMVSELARRATRSIGVDFGAVDIIARITPDSSDYFVLEVNSAPGILGNASTLEAYLNYFRSWGESLA